MFRFIAISISFFIIFSSSSCTQPTKKEELKLYNIPEIDNLSKKIAEQPDNAALYAARSLVFSEKEMLQEAELDAEKALQLDSTKVDYYRLLSNAYFDNFHSHTAIKTLQKAIGRFPDEIPLYLSLAEMQMLVEQYNDCILTLDMLFKVSQDNPDGIYIKGQVYKLLGDTLKAQENFEKSVAIDADNINAYLQLALIYKRKNDPLAIQYLDNVLRLDSLHEGALITKAQFYHFRSEYEKAEEEYKNAIIKLPQSADLNYNLALMYIEMGDKYKSNPEKSAKYYESALRHFDNATKFDVQFADAYYYKAIAALRMGNKELAVRDYENALRLIDFLETVAPETVEQELAKLK